MSDDDDTGVYSGLKLLPAAIKLLGGAHAPEREAAVTVRRVKRGDGMQEDEFTINWTRVMNPRHASTDLQLARMARSLIERTPVDLWDTCHFGPGTWQHVIDALTLARDAR